MSQQEEKEKTVERVTKKFLLLPTEKQKYIEGYMTCYIELKEETEDKQTA